MFTEYSFQFCVCLFVCLFFQSLTDLGITSITADALKELTSLEDLDLSKNNLKILDLNSIHLPSLKVLNLSENQLSTVHVDAVTAFPCLENLNVSNNATLEVSTLICFNKYILCNRRLPSCLCFKASPGAESFI